MHNFLALLKRNLLTIGMSVVVAGLILVLIGTAMPNNKEVSLTTKPTSKTQPQKAEAKVEGAAIVEPQPVTTTPVASATPSAPKKTPVTAPKSAATPTPAPKPTTPTQPSRVPTVVTSANVTLLAGCAGAYKYTINLFGNTAATVSMRWEYVSGDNGHPLNALPSAYPIAASQWGPTKSSLFDTVSPGLIATAGQAYSARIHVTSPNDFYSNIISVPDNCSQI